MTKKVSSKIRKTSHTPPMNLTLHTTFKPIGSKIKKAPYAPLLKNIGLKTTFEISLCRAGISQSQIKNEQQFNKTIIIIETGLSGSLLVMFGSRNANNAHWFKKINWDRIEYLCKKASIPLALEMRYNPVGYVCIALDNIGGYYLKTGTFEKKLQECVSKIRKYTKNPIHVRLHPKNRRDKIINQKILKMGLHISKVSTNILAKEVGVLIIFHSTLGYEMLCRGIPIFMIEKLSDSIFTNVAYLIETLGQTDADFTCIERRNSFLYKYFGHMLPKTDISTSYFKELTLEYANTQKLA